VSSSGCQNWTPVWQSGEHPCLTLKVPQRWIQAAILEAHSCWESGRTVYTKTSPEAKAFEMLVSSRGVSNGTPVWQLAVRPCRTRKAP
jgi:hypothetical protein